MRKLLNTLYVMSEDAYLTLDGENIVISKKEEKIARFPIHTLESIISFSYVGASPALVGACLERSVGICFYSPKGKFMYRAVGKEYGNVLLRKQQYRISDDLNQSHKYAKNMIAGKVFNARWCLERTLRDHAYRVNAEKIKTISEVLKEGYKTIRTTENLDTLRGLEGNMAERYFSVFDEMILNQKENFSFSGRTRRPPQDCVNALLSFGYAILAGECANALNSVGLDPYVGFLHRDRPGRKSLALDLMEELRVPMVDRFVISMINKRIIQKKHLDIQQDGAVLLNDEGRKIFFQQWQERKKEIIKHPFLEEKLEWGLISYVQALLLARTIRGDLDEYPTFLWK